MGNIRPRITVYQLWAELPESGDVSFCIREVEVIEAGFAFIRPEGGGELRKHVDFNVLRQHNQRNKVLTFRKWLMEVNDKDKALHDFKLEVERKLKVMVQNHRVKARKAQEDFQKSELRLRRASEAILFSLKEES